MGPLHSIRRGQFPPIDRHVGAEPRLTQLHQTSRIGHARQRRTCHLVHGDDPALARTIQECLLRSLSLGGRDRCEDRTSGSSHRHIAQPARWIESRERLQLGHGRDQCTGNQSGVDVDARQEHHTPPGGSIDLLPVQWPRIVPPCFVPAMADDGGATALPRPVGKRLDHIHSSGVPGEVQAGDRHTRSGGVHVCIDETGCDEGAVAIDHGVG